MPQGCATMVTRVATKIPRSTHCTRAPFPAGRTHPPADNAWLATTGVAGTFTGVRYTAWDGTRITAENAGFR